MVGLLSNQEAIVHSAIATKTIRLLVLVYMSQIVNPGLRFSLTTDPKPEDSNSQSNCSIVLIHGFIAHCLQLHEIVLKSVSLG